MSQQQQQYFESSADAVQSLIAELEAMDENALNEFPVTVPSQPTLSPPPPPPPPPPRPPLLQSNNRNRRRKKPESLSCSSSSSSNNKNSEMQYWKSVQCTDDIPYVSWVNQNLLFTVRDPNNDGDLLMKIVIHDRNRISHKCALFLDTKRRDHGPAVRALKQLIHCLKTLWTVPGGGGGDYKSGVTQTVSALPKWRVLEKDVTSNDCTTRRNKKVGGGGVDVTPADCTTCHNTKGGEDATPADCTSVLDRAVPAKRSRRGATKVGEGSTACRHS